MADLETFKEGDLEGLSIGKGRYPDEYAPRDFERTYILISGTPSCLPYPIEEENISLGSAVVTDVTHEVRVTESLHRVATLLVEDIDEFREMERLSPKEKASVIALTQRFFKRMSEGGRILAIAPSVGVGRRGDHYVMNKFRFIAEAEDEMEWRTRPALFAIIKDWEEYSRYIPKEAKIATLIDMKKNQPGWDAVAVACGYFSGLKPEELRQFAVTARTLAFLDELTPIAEEQGRTYKGIFKAVEAFQGLFPHHIAAWAVKYQVPVVYGMDFGSVVREVLTQNEGIRYSKQELQSLMERYGSLMLLRPIDAFAAELARVPIDKNPFSRTVDMHTIIERIESFIRGHKYEPRVAPAAIEAVVA